MAINLQKGQRISLTKESAGLSNIMVALGWDPVKNSKKGILGNLFGGSESDIDCDASVFMLRENDRITGKQDIVYFGNLKSSDGSIRHMGDNLTGAGEGDDEQIMVELNSVPSDIQKLVFVVNIYNCEKRHQHFGMIENAFIRIVDLNGAKELLRFNLTDDYGSKTALIVAELYRHGAEWKFAAIGEGTSDKNISEMLKRYR